jgi:sugar lactone lactonase YvrE
MGTTNGIAVSTDNKFLYVNESVQRNVWRYKLDSQGNVSNKTLLINFADHGLDGMRTDQHGNLYIARYGKGVIAILSPQGKLIREVALKGLFPTNLTFGGINGKQVFVTMQKRGAIESFFIE